MPPDAEETTDLEHGEQGTVARNDEVVDGADLLVLLVGDAAARELRRALALRDRTHVDGDEPHRLRNRWARVRQNQEQSR